MHTLTDAAGAHGSINGVSPKTVVDGGDGTPVEALPDYRCHFVDWNDGSTANPSTDTAVSADVGVTASFEPGFVPVTLDGAPTKATGYTTTGSTTGPALSPWGLHAMSPRTIDVSGL